MAHALIVFLIVAIVVIGVAYIIIMVLKAIPGLPPFVLQIAVPVLALVALLVILDRALPLLGVAGL